VNSIVCRCSNQIGVDGRDFVLDEKKVCMCVCVVVVEMRLWVDYDWLPVANVGGAN